MTKTLLVIALFIATITCSYVYCPSKKIIGKCSNVYTPVCAYRGEGEPQTYDNACYACTDSSILAFTTGSCAETLDYCPYKRSDCRVLRNYNPSCAFEAGKPPQNIDSNFCCINTSYTVVKTGLCPMFRRGSVPGVTYCPSERPTNCNTDQKPVCGLTTDRRRINYDNWCFACLESTNIWGYFEGTCELRKTKHYHGFKFPQVNTPPFQSVDFNEISASTSLSPRFIN